MDHSRKILSFENAAARLKIEKASGKSIVQCHGTFDLVHPGHIVHFEEARERGDLLVVTVTAAEFVNKGPGRPYFNDELRCKSLAALECVDYVIPIPFAAAVEAIECVAPDIYCKGKEYENQEEDVTGNIADDVSTVEKIGGKIEYLGSIVFSSTKLINNGFSHVSDQVKEFCKELSAQFLPSNFRSAVDSFTKLKALVIGDAIIDKYTYVAIQGLTSKNRILSGRFKEDSVQLGGALAIYRHLKDFCGQVDIACIVGNEPWLSPIIKENGLANSPFLFEDPEFLTIVKQRFVESSKRSQELGKLFSTNYINPDYRNRYLEDRIIDTISKKIKDYDIILVADFGHGLLTQKLRTFIQSEAPFLALNCQTNSYNHGYNLISQRYHHANVFTLDDQELMLDRGTRTLDPHKDLEALRADLGSHMAWVTRGAKETVGIDSLGRSASCGRFEAQVVDTIGAGDAFFSLAALAAQRDLPIELGTFLGQLAGAQAVKIIGNTQSISKATLLKGGMSLLNF